MLNLSVILRALGLLAIVLIVVALLVLAAHAAPARAETATWYAEGRVTANGERFDPDGHTCAHRSYAFGTHLRVTFRARSVICRVNDRGPATWTGAAIDLSRGAARIIGLLDVGRGQVRIERL